MVAESLKSCPTLRPPGTVALQGSSQARIPEWAANSFSRDLSNPGIEAVSSALAGGFFITGPPGKPRLVLVVVVT